MWYIVLSPAKPILRLWPNKKSSGQTCRSKQIAIECRQGQALANRQFQISGIVQRKAILLRQWEKRRATRFLVVADPDRNEFQILEKSAGVLGRNALATNVIK